ncbi:MAG: TerB family tellurite resistance protein [Bacteroidetes bacterium]|nr:TerB family tellurite resistance protein [Bacteroidota bacterium]
MAHRTDYQLGLLYLVHLLISADGVVDASEEKQLLKICEKESIPPDVFAQFKEQVSKSKDREIYQRGIELINKCTDDEKLDAFVHLYKMSEADGTVHVKEVRLLLYSIKMADIEFNDVVARATQTKS